MGATTPPSPPTSSRTRRSGSSSGSPMWSRPTSPRPRDWRPCRVAPAVGLVTDVSGEGLTNFGDAGLSNISGDLSKNPPPGKGKPGLDVQIETTKGKGKVVPNSQAIVVAPDNIPSITTTISAADETAARTAVAMHTNSSMVVIQPSTGDILAVANNDGFNDFALTAAVAPGSSMKIITSTALFNSGRITPQTPVTCPPTYHHPGNHLPQRPERVRAGRDAVHDRLRAVLQQRVHHPGAVPERQAGEHRQGLLRPGPGLGHRHRRSVRVVLQRAGQRLGV